MVEASIKVQICFLDINTISFRFIVPWRALQNYNLINAPVDSKMCSQIQFYHKH